VPRVLVQGRRRRGVNYVRGTETYSAGMSLAHMKIEELKLIGLTYTPLPGSLASRVLNLLVSRVKLALMFHLLLCCFVS
jgi:hypothetical protein